MAIKNKSEKRKMFIALGIVLGLIALCMAFYFVANTIVVDECGGDHCKNNSSPLCKVETVCEPLTLWESIFGE